MEPGSYSAWYKPGEGITGRHDKARPNVDTAASINSHRGFADTSRIDKNPNGVYFFDMKAEGTRWK